MGATLQAFTVSFLSSGDGGFCNLIFFLFCLFSVGYDIFITFKRRKEKKLIGLGKIAIFLAVYNFLSFFLLVLNSVCVHNDDLYALSYEKVMRHEKELQAI